jgi:ubiquinol-cytochrome c reductase iron-sulfur subunit
VSTTLNHTADDEPTRRDFLYLATGAFGLVGAAATIWPFIDQMNPDASTLALSSIDIDVGGVAVGQEITVKWRGKPVFVRQRTPQEIAAAKAVDVSALRDQNAQNPNLPANSPATDANRTAPGKEAWLIQIGICTHLGCIPNRGGNYEGWLCPCHGSQYDSAGRIRQGPAPENLHIPPYKFTAATKLHIG